MKKIIMLGSFFLFLFSCDTSTESCLCPPTNDTFLIGTWNVTNIVYQNITVGSIEPEVSGTILFREDGTGRENFTYSISGIPIPNISNFTWASTNTQILFDEGTNDETTWQRLQNTATIQVGRFNESTGNTTITITLEK